MERTEQATFSQECDLDDDASVDRAVRRGVREAILEHRRDGDPIIVWQDGKVVEIPAEEIVIPDEEA